ncbi:MAG: NUDIX domain-containing protein [Burkholderiales bacterium]|nr:NUDIX domain-containing protein [Burkholderiales bacterium]
MIWIEKACACVVRREHLLLFEHPTAGVQIPKGGIERGEQPIDAAVRVLREESGLSLLAAPTYVSTLEFERPPKRRVHGGKVTWQRWVLFRFDTDETLPELGHTPRPAVPTRTG